jgi:hypothetical protein
VDTRRPADLAPGESLLDAFLDRVDADAADVAAPEP